MQLIKEMNISLKSSVQNFSNPNNIRKYSLLLVEPFKKSTTKIMEAILSSMEEFLKYNLVDPNTLQKMVEKCISYIFINISQIMKLIYLKLIYHKLDSNSIFDNFLLPFLNIFHQI